MRRVRCPYCGAEFGVPEGVSHAVCPYCGTVVELETGSSTATYIYPARLEEPDVEGFLSARLPLLPGADPKVSEASVAETVLHYIPLFNVRVVSRARGCDAAYEVAEAALEATREPPQGFPEGYSYPVIGRVPYHPDTRRKAIFHQVGFDWRLHPGLVSLRSRVESRVARESIAYCGGAPIESSVELLGVSHYPVWEVVYEHRGGRRYRVLVDAVEARLVYAEYPVGGAGRRVMLAAAGVTAGLGTLTSLAAAALLHATAPLLGAPLAIAAAAYALTRALRRRLVYRLKSRVYNETVGRLEPPSYSSA